MSKRCVITGSEGFVGQYVTKKFLDEGYVVLGIDNLSKYGKRRVLEHKRYVPRYEDAEGMIARSHITQFKPDVVIDLAEDVGGITYLNNNAVSKLVSSTQIRANILNAISKSTRYVCISSSAVYERINTFPTPEIDNIDLPTPLSPYALTKINAEHISCLSGGNVCIARLFNVAGKGDDHPDKAHVIADLVKKFKNCNGSPVSLVGTGQQIRNFTHGEDVADALYLIGTASIPGQIYNVGSHNTIRIWDLAVEIARRVGINSGLQPTTNPIYNIHRSEPCLRKLCALGYEAKWGMGRILDEAVEYYV